MSPQQSALAQALSGAQNAPKRRSPMHRWGGWILLAGLVVFLIWAALAPLAQGVPADGFVVVDGQRKSIQSLRGGVVEKILVSEGQQVKAGQPVVILSATQFRSQQAQIEAQLAASLAIEARLLAERNAQGALIVPQMIIQKAPQFDETIRVQQQLFATRRASLKGEEAIVAQTIAGLQAQAVGFQSQETARGEQLRLLREELASIKPLVDQGFVPRTRLLELERSVALMLGQRGEDLSSIARVQTAINETRYRLLQSKGQYQKEVETQLTDVQRQVADYRERLVSVQDDLQRSVLTAPVDGIVVDLALHTEGGVASPGQKLLDIVPVGQKLVLEVKIPTHLVDNITINQRTRVNFIAIDQVRSPNVTGRLVYLSADRLVDARSDVSHFVGRVQVDADQLVGVAAKAMQPGVPVSVVISTGERSFLSYLLRPILSRYGQSLTER